MDALQDAGLFPDGGQIGDSIVRKRYSPHAGGARVLRFTKCN